MTGLADPGNEVITVLGVPLITAVLLPGGGVHALSWAMTPGVDQPGHLLWQHAAAAAAARGRPVLVRIGRPSGQVDAYAVTGSGDRAPHYLRHTATTGAPDPRWSEQLPNRDDLLQEALAADRAGDFESAAQAAGRLAACLEAELGEDHPHVWLATELQADLALLTGRWEQAAALYREAALARLTLRSPQDPALRCLRLATTAWLRTHDHQPTATGLGLAHTLITYLPGRTNLLRVVVQHLPTPGHRADPAVRSITTTTREGNP